MANFAECLRFCWRSFGSRVHHPPRISRQSFRYACPTILLAVPCLKILRLNLARRVSSPASPQSLKEKRVHRRPFVSHHIPRAIATLSRILASAWLGASLLRGCAIIRRFFSSKTICESRELLYPESHPGGPFLWLSRRPCTENLKEISMKIRVLSLAFAAVLLMSLSASAATHSTCCGDPACCNGGDCCN